MKLKVTKHKSDKVADFTQARALLNELVGNSFAIASGNDVLVVKASDLLEFIEAQEVNEGSKGDTENE